MPIQNRRANDEEDRLAWREYIKTYGERLKMELDILPILKQSIERIEAAVNRQSIAIYGNGNPENGLCYRVATNEEKLRALHERINGFFKTDDWRKDFVAGAVRSIATAVIAAAIIYFLKK
jgi:hypothetical protein